VIHEVYLEDSGEYKCTARNINGMAHTSCRLMVERKYHALNLAVAGMLHFLKFWWDEELKLLKQDSINSNKAWKEAGKPRSGPVFY